MEGGTQRWCETPCTPLRYLVSTRGAKTDPNVVSLAPWSSSATLNPKLSNTYTVRCKMEDGIKTYINGICIVRLCSGDVEDLDETEVKDAMVLAGHDPLRIIRDAAAVAVSTHGSTLAAKAKAKYEVKGGVDGGGTESPSSSDSDTGMEAALVDDGSVKEAETGVEARAEKHNPSQGDRLRMAQRQSQRERGEWGSERFEISDEVWAAGEKAVIKSINGDTKTFTVVMQNGSEQQCTVDQLRHRAPRR
jgi:hypothetical protein